MAAPAPHRMQMNRTEIAEMLDGVRYQNYGVTQDTLIDILESHLIVLDKLTRVATCR